MPTAAKATLTTGALAIVISLCVVLMVAVVALLD